MNQNFRQAIAELNNVNEDFQAGRISSVSHAHAREAALIAAMNALAEQFGVKLAPMHGIDARGDLHIVALDADKDPRLGSGHYGYEFAELLNTARPRTGIAYNAVLYAESGWCYLNHFEVERLVQRFFAEHV